jgi:parallel beta-helix repeat protein
MRCRGIQLVGIWLAIVAGILLVRAADAQARPKTGRSHYVATTGSDTNPGTEAAPFRTLARGVSVLTPGDTLYITSGTYAESLIHTIPPGTSWEHPVTVAAAPGHTVTLKPGPGAGSVLRFIGPQQYIIIDGLILDGTNADNEVVKITTGGSDSPAHHIRLQNSELRNSAGQGVLVTGIGADRNEFISLNVHHNGLSEYDHGFYIDSSHNVVENCSIHNNSGYGVHIYNGYTGPGRRANGNLVRNNTVFANGWRGILLGSGDGNMAYNNVVWGNRGGIRIGFFNPTNNQVYNNTVYDNTDWGIWVQQGTGAVVQNNIVYKNGAPELQDTGTGSVIANNLVGIDPRFVNAAGGDFHVQPGSPAINAGVDVGLTADIASTLRPQGGGHDIGAFEAIF